MFKGTTLIPQIPKDTPLFIKNLVYKESGHTLTHLRGYYVCSKKQKGQCKNQAEKNLSIINFERKFSRYTDNLRIDESVGKKLFYEIQKKNIDLREIYDDKTERQQNNMQTVIDAIKKDVELGKEIRKSDIYCFNDYYKSTLKITFIFYIALVLEGTIVVFGRSDLTAKDRMAQFITLINKTFISNTGSIESIELECLGDYIFSYLQNKIPGYLHNFKIPLVDRKKFESLDPIEAIKNFEADNFRNVLSYSMFANKYGEDEQIKFLFKFMKGAKPKEVIQTLYLLKKLSKSLAGLIGLYTFSKNNNEAIFNNVSGRSKKGKSYSRRFTAIVFR